MTGSNACKSLKTLFAPFPPNMIILDPAKTDVCPYRAGGGVPEILGFIHLEELTSKTYVSLRYLKPDS